MPILFKNIKSLVQVRETEIPYVAGSAMQLLPEIPNAFLQIENGTIAAFGAMADCPDAPDCEVIDASGKYILPTWCDSHTHLVYAGHRETEFVDRIHGLSYADIAAKGGGILNSANVLQQTPEADLYTQSQKRLEAAMGLGTGAIEIKSGYGLTPEAELKMLRVIQRLKKEYAIPIKATFLGAHALPALYQNRAEDYIDVLIDSVLPIIARDQLADFIDVFCETGYFSVAQTERLLTAGVRYGLRPKIHVNQFTAIGGVQAGVKHRALSVDHLEIVRDEDIKSLKGTATMPVALPGCSLFLGIPYTPARQLINAGLPLALATDFNPGSAPSGNMNLMVALACIQMNMTPEEAINAATLNGAYAMGLEQEMGSITVGKRANLILTDPLNSLAAIPYHFGMSFIDTIFINGKALEP